MQIVKPGKSQPKPDFQILKQIIGKLTGKEKIQNGWKKEVKPQEWCKETPSYNDFRWS